MSTYWTYTPYRDSVSFVIESPDGDLLIGDQLPSTEKEARLLCRVANIAREQAIAETKDHLLTAMEKAMKAL